MSSWESAASVVEKPVKNDQGNFEFWRKDPPVFQFAPEGVAPPIAIGGMLPHQRELWDLPNFVKALVGGYGSGKTYIGSKRAIALALENAPCPVAVVSPTFPQARHTTIATIKAMLAGKQTIYGRDFWWRYNETLHEFKIRFRGRNALIIVYSGEKPDSLRGPNLAAVWMDEPFLQDEDVFKQMVARVRHPDAACREILLTGTPEQLNWGWDLLMGEQREKYDTGLVVASTRQNVSLDPGYVARLLSAYDGKAADAYVEGKFVNLSTGIVYYGFDHQTHIKELEMPEYPQLGVGMDFNVNPMAVVAFWRSGSHLHFFWEKEFENADTEYVCSVLSENFGENGTMARGLRDIFPDATGSARKTSAPGGKSDFSYIRAAGFTVNAAHENPKRRDRYNAVNGKLKPRQGPATISISKKGCPKLIKYLSIYSHEEMKKQEAMSHLLDAFGYPISYLFPVSKMNLGVHKVAGV